MSGPKHAWIKHFVHDFEYNPEFQFRFHLFAMCFWILNVPAAIILMFGFPQTWTKLAILYVLLVSLYANGDTDYDAMSASLAAIHAKRAAQISDSSAQTLNAVVEQAESHVAAGAEDTPEAGTT